MRTLSVIMVAALALAGAASAGSAAADPAPVPNSAPAGGSYVPATPARLLDTRTSGGAVMSVTVHAGGRAGLPASGVAAVAVNLTVVTPAHGGYGVGFRAGSTQPAVSSINFAAGRTTAEAAILATDASGTFIVRLSTPAQLLVDVTGWFTDPAGATANGRYVPLSPARSYDTRTTRHPLVGGTSRSVAITGQHGVPASGVQAVVLNVAAVAPRGSGYVTVWPGGPRPAVSTLNVTQGTTRANRVIVRPDGLGRVALYSSTTTDAIVDVAGYFADTDRGGYYVPLTPHRWADTRSAPGSALGAASDFSLTIASVDPVPRMASMAPPLAAAATVTVIPAAHRPVAGHLTVWPAGIARPPTSDINFPTDASTGNLITTSLGPSGGLAAAPDLQFQSTVDIVVDVTGYFARTLPPSTPSGVWAVGPRPGVAPDHVNEESGVRALASSQLLTDALHGDGTVDEWSETMVQNADPAHSGNPGEPVPGLHGIVALAAGDVTQYALDSDGQVWSWGVGAQGQLGDGTTVSRSTPAVVAGLPPVTAIFAGSRNAYAVAADGTTYGWGENDGGQLGDGSSTGRLTPVVITGLEGPVSIAGTPYTTRAVLPDGSSLVWGRLGSGSVADSPQPVTRVCAARGVISDGGLFTTLCADGTVDGAAGLDDVARLAHPVAGDLVALRSDGTVWLHDTVWHQVPGLTSISVLDATRRWALTSTGA